MPDISIPGIKSRFDTNSTVEKLMELERIPRKRIEKNVETLQTQKGTWQALGLRITALRDGASQLYSFQNPFNERQAVSDNPAVIGASVTREAREQSYDFTVKQLAAADRFVSAPLEKNYRVAAGDYRFKTGENEVFFKFSGGSLQEFSDAINRRSGGKLNASLLSIKSGTSSIVIGSRVTGLENKLEFEADAMKFAQDVGILGKPKKVEPLIIKIAALPARAMEKLGVELTPDSFSVPDGSSLKVAALSDNAVSLNNGIKPVPSMTLNFESALSDNSQALAADEAYNKALAARQTWEDEMALWKEDVKVWEKETAAWQTQKEALLAAEEGGQYDYGTEEDAGSSALRPHNWAGNGNNPKAWITPSGKNAAGENNAAGAADGDGAAEGTEAAADSEAAAEKLASLPPAPLKPPPPAEAPPLPETPIQRTDNLAALYLKFSDGSMTELPPVYDAPDWTGASYNLFDITGGKTVSSIEILNKNTHRDIAIRNIEIIDTAPKGAFDPSKPISTAQDAVLVMDGIEIERSNNKIDDLIPGVTLDLHSISEKPVNLRIENAPETIKDAIINMVGNYNRLMAELNVLTRQDEKVINELTYLNDEEREALSAKLGSLAGDSSALKLRADLISIVSMAYPTEKDGDVMLANFGISTDAGRAGATGYDPSRLRAYLEIDEKTLDNAIATNFDAIKELFGRDTDGDHIVDSGLAFSLVRVARPFVEIGGIIAGKTSGLDSKITADNRRIESIDRQLVRKEADLKRQYGQMEDAYNRMERMSNSLDNFAAQSSNNKR